MLGSCSASSAQKKTYVCTVQRREAFEEVSAFKKSMIFKKPQSFPRLACLETDIKHPFYAFWSLS